MKSGINIRAHYSSRIYAEKIFKKIKNYVDKYFSILYYISCVWEKQIQDICTSGSVVEYRLAKARVAGSNPVSCFSI